MSSTTCRAPSEQLGLLHRNRDHTVPLSICPGAPRQERFGRLSLPRRAAAIFQAGFSPGATPASRLESLPRGARVGGHLGQVLTTSYRHKSRMHRRPMLLGRGHPSRGGDPGYDSAAYSGLGRARSLLGFHPCAMSARRSGTAFGVDIQAICSVSGAATARNSGFLTRLSTSSPSRDDLVGSVGCDVHGRRISCGASGLPRGRWGVFGPASGFVSSRATRT